MHLVWREQLAAAEERQLDEERAADDLAPELLDVGRRLATAAGVGIDWEQGDAEALPYADGSFDVVLSCVGVMFAPHLPWRDEEVRGRLAARWGTVVALDNDGERLQIDVVDDGRGLEPGFDVDSATSLGLSIVRTLVTTELNGQISMRPAAGDDLRQVGLAEHSGDHGTVVRLVVPLRE